MSGDGLFSGVQAIADRRTGNIEPAADRSLCFAERPHVGAISPQHLLPMPAKSATLLFQARDDDF